MKKLLLITLIFTLFCFTAKAQIINQPANWPNENWSLSGIYDIDYLDANPTLNTGSSSFSFNDDAAGGTSDNNIGVESPIIDLSAAPVANETNILVSFDYVYNIYQNDQTLTKDHVEKH